MPAPEHPKVFISYSHDSHEHRDHVLTFPTACVSMESIAVSISMKYHRLKDGRNG
jgi:hypothetical protein